VAHIRADSSGHKDFTSIIKRAMELPGYTAEDVERAPKKRNVTVRFSSSCSSFVDAVDGGAVRG
jgi:hydroxylamine reductase